MKHLLICLAAGLLAITGVQAQTAAATTTTVTTSNGTLHEYTAGTTFIVKETTGPVTYSYGPDIVYATRAGVVLTPEQIQTRVRAGVPVRVEYAPEGETRIIRRVILDEDEIEEIKDED